MTSLDLNPSNSVNINNLIVDTANITSLYASIVNVPTGGITINNSIDNGNTLTIGNTSNYFVYDSNHLTVYNTSDDSQTVLVLNRGNNIIFDTLQCVEAGSTIRRISGSLNPTLTIRDNLGTFEFRNTKFGMTNGQMILQNDGN